MRIAVLMGGRSGEHEVSLRSGQAVLDAAAALGWEALAVVFDKAGRATALGSIGETLAALEAWRPDAAFIAMHGPYGEDGRVQGALELLGIPYQGSGVLASALGLDKIRTKAALAAAGLPLAADRVVYAARGFTAGAAAELVHALGLPLVLKTPQSGSSVGVEIVRDEAALAARIPALLADADRVLVEAYVAGREFTAPVLVRDGRAEALPIVEIRPKTAAFFDYGAKYTPGASDELCPAPIPPELEAELRTIGLAAHAAIGAAGYSRTDILLGASGPVVLEVNTLPGLTAESLLPKSARAAGLSFPELIAALVKDACTSAQARAER